MVFVILFSYVIAIEYSYITVARFFSLNHTIYILSLVDESHRKEQHIERRELRQKRRERKLIKLQRDLHMKQKKAERQQKQQQQQQQQQLQLQQNNRSTIRSYDDNNLSSSTDSKRSKLRRIKSTSILNKSNAMPTSETKIASTQPSSMAINKSTLRQNKQVQQKQSIGSKGIRLWNRKKTTTSSLSVSFHESNDNKSSFTDITENIKSKPSDANKSTASLASLGTTTPIVSPAKSMQRSLSSPLMNSSSEVEQKITKDSTASTVIAETNYNDKTDNNYPDDVKSDEKKNIHITQKKKDTWLSIDMEENPTDTFIAKEEDMV